MLCVHLVYSAMCLDGGAVHFVGVCDSMYVCACVLVTRISVSLWDSVLAQQRPNDVPSKLLFSFVSMVSISKEAVKLRDYALSPHPMCRSSEVRLGSCATGMNSYTGMYYTM